MTISSLCGVVFQLALGIVLAEPQTSTELCDDGAGPPCDVVNLVQHSAVDLQQHSVAGLDLWPDERADSSRCGHSCTSCRLSFCTECLEGYELILGKCMLTINFDDLVPPFPENVTFPVPNGYRGFDYTGLNAMDPLARGDGRETSGYNYGLTSSKRVAYNRFGGDVTIMTSIGILFSIYSIQITPAWCSPLVVAFRGERADGTNVFYSEILEFDPRIPVTHVNGINLFVRGFIGIILLEISTFEYPGASCPYRASSNPESIGIDNMMVFS